MIYAPILMIIVSMTIGAVLGAIGMLYVNYKEIKSLEEELDKFRDLYFEEMDKWRNKYIDDGHNFY